MKKDDPRNVLEYEPQRSRASHICKLVLKGAVRVAAEVAVLLMLAFLVRCSTRWLISK
jgi:hypothetical protein